MAKKMVGRSKDTRGRINKTAYKTLFDDVRNTPEFRKGYEKEMLKEFAREIKLTREKQGLSQKNIADMLGTRQQVIARFEKGAEDIKMSTFFRYVNVLQFDIGKLMPLHTTTKHV
jgi:ribosome-binding protein aMBF1 (putative translation factor)